MCLPRSSTGTVPRIAARPTGSLNVVDSGIARKIDDLGRIVIPAETRRMFNIREGDHLLISVEGGSIVLRKMTDSCTFCGTDESVSQFKGKGICTSCRAQLGS